MKKIRCGPRSGSRGHSYPMPGASRPPPASGIRNRIGQAIKTEKRKQGGLHVMAKFLGGLTLALLAIANLAQPAHAQSDFPNRVVTIVVPFPAGGALDS